MSNKVYKREGNIIHIIDEKGQEFNIKSDELPVEKLREYLKDYTDITSKEQEYQAPKQKSPSDKVEEIKQDIQDSSKGQEFIDIIKGKNPNQIQKKIQNPENNVLQELRREREMLRERWNLKDPMQKTMTIQERDQIQKRMKEIDDQISKIGE
jgi:hypothetical protein